MKKLNWSNFPIPEGHLILLIVGVALHILHPVELFETSWLTSTLGAILMFMGLLLATWAFVTAGAVELHKPTMIITTGPFAFSRNPMYVAWTVIYIATAMLVDTWWLIMLLPALMLFTHYFVIRREERQLALQFEEQYRQYCVHVRRYL